MKITVTMKQILLAFCLTLMAPVLLAEEKATVERPYTVNIRNADIEQFIEKVAEMTGKNFVVDPRVRTRDVTVISTQPLSAAEVYELFLSVLQVHGYAAVPAGEVIKIVNNTTAKQSNLPLVEGRDVQGEELITRVIPVENAPVDELVPVLRPLVPQYGHLAAVSSANVLVISDHADNIRRMEAILRHLEGTESQDVEIIPLQHAWVGEMVKLLENLVPERGGRRKDQPSSVTLVADERTNRLIVKGDKLARDRISSLVSELDVPASQSGGLQVMRLSHADAKGMAELLKAFTEAKTAGQGGDKPAAPQGGVSIQADESLNALVIRAEPAIMNELKMVISQLDVRRTQILIEAAIVEVSADKGAALGFQYAAGGEDDGVAAINFSNVGVSVGNILSALAADEATGVNLGDGITAGGGERDDDGALKWGVLVQALAGSTDANLLSTPSILTLENQEASIIVGENVPFVTGQSTDTGAGVSNPFTTIQRQDVGLTLKVTPYLAGLNTIRLKLEQETSAVKDSASGADTQQPVDIVTTTRKIMTTVLADDGETIVLGGLIRDDVREVVRKVPLLGDIPILGALFRSKSKSRSKQNLMLFLRPTILSNNERLLELSRQRYLGITAMQFEVDRRGELRRVVPSPLPTRADDLFGGRDDLPEGLSEAVREAHGEAAADSGEPYTPEPGAGAQEPTPVVAPIEASPEADEADGEAGSEPAEVEPEAAG